MKKRRNAVSGVPRPGKARLGRAWRRARRPKEIVGLAWYSEQEWRRLRELADDVAALDDTYDDWLKQAERVIAELRSNGLVIVKVVLDVEAAAEWCASAGRPFNTAGRAAYAAELLHSGRARTME
jgi:hypothetical protein